MSANKRSIVLSTVGSGFFALAAAIIITTILAQAFSQLTYIIIGFILLVGSFILIKRVGLAHFATGGAIVSFVLGWRGYEIIPGFRMWPAEVFIWIGFLIVLLDTSKKGDPSANKQTNLLALFLGLSTTAGLVIGLTQPWRAVNTISGWKNFILFLPLLLIINRTIPNIDTFKKYLRLITLSGFVVAVLGILEYYFPAFVSDAFNIHQDLSYFRVNYLQDTYTVINLSSFFIWGTSVVSVILVPILPISAFLTINAKGRRKFLWVLVSLSLLTSVIFSGYRSAWLGLGVAMIGLTFFFDKRIWGFLVLVGTGIWFMPEGFYQRAASIFQLRQASDPTIVTRLGSIQSATDTFSASNLLGSGWGARAVFNDWLYIYVVLGLVGALIFLAWYLQTIIRIFKIEQSDGEIADIKKTMILSLVSYGFCMVSGAMSQVPPIMALFWIIFIFGFHLPTIIQQETK